MTAEQKMKQVHPGAYAERMFFGRLLYWHIYLDRNIVCHFAQAAHRESWAWANAWRRIQREKKEAQSA